MMKTSGQLKSCIDHIGTIFTTFTSKAVKLLSYVDTYNQMFKTMDEHMENLNTIVKDLNSILEDKENSDKSFVFQMHVIPNYPLIWFQMLNIVKYKQTLDTVLSSCNTLMELLEPLTNKETFSKDEDEQMNSIEPWTTYFVISHVEKWTAIIISSLDVIERINQEYKKKKEFIASREHLNLNNNNPFIRMFLDVANGMRNSRNVIDYKYWMIIAFLKCWQRKNMLTYNYNGANT